MPIMIIDTDEPRLKLLKERVTRYAPGVEVLPSPSSTVPMSAPTLVLWHVGDRQHGKEPVGAVSATLTEASNMEGCYIAGFTGGTIADAYLRQMPNEGDSFVVNRQAARNTVPEAFGDAVDRVVRAWVSNAGKFAPGGLSAAWLGIDPVLEAKLTVLSALLAPGAETPDQAVRVLQHTYPAASSAGTQRWTDRSVESILALRKLLFDE